MTSSPSRTSRSSARTALSAPCATRADFTANSWQEQKNYNMQNAYELAFVCQERRRVVRRGDGRRDRINCKTGADAICASAPVFRIVFPGSFRRFNGDLEHDLPHRPALARGDARRVRVLRKEDRKPPAAERQLCRFALIEPYVTPGGLGHPLHRGERRNADEPSPSDEVLDVDILPVRLGPVVFRLCFIALKSANTRSPSISTRPASTASSSVPVR